MSLTRQVKSQGLRMALQEARALWGLGKTDAATERAAKVFREEGREVFATSDAALLEATLKRLAQAKKR